MHRVPWKRLLLILFFLGVNFVLGLYFLSQFNVELPPKAVAFLELFNLHPQGTRSSSRSILTATEPDLNSTGLLEAVNAERSRAEVSPLEESATLDKAAEQLFALYQQHNYQIEAVSEQELERILKNVGYPYQWVSNNALVGPLTVEEVMRTWSDNEQQYQSLVNPDFKQTGVFTQIVKQDGIEVGVVVHLLAKPQAGRGPASPQTVKPAGTTTTRPNAQSPELSDQEVMEALNSYRTTHGRSALSVDANLCTYAEKRVADLVAYGGLDGHEGFKRDFADPNNLPVGIRDYPGSKIGENLAHQFCKNMQTGESFVATTGTALIEWCFDSSTRGHREAQLSSEFKSMCVRHGSRMYVVIFGD